MLKCANTMLLALLLLLSSATVAIGQSEQRQVISLSDSIGSEIDAAERAKYNLFPGISGFQSARIVRWKDSQYRLEYSFSDAAGVHQKSRKLSAQAVELTRLHVRLVEEFHISQQTKEPDDTLEAAVIYRLGLKYAAQNRHEITSILFADLLQNYPQSPHASHAKAYSADLDQLWKTKKALFWRGALLDQSGRTELLIFSGYYGLWLGIATPIALSADSPQAFALGLLLGAPISLGMAHGATKEANISDGRATMIALGGHLGTWQGIGWAANADADGHTVVGIGEIGGLVGIGAAALLTSKTEFSPGHAELISSGMPWGAWFGLVAGALANWEDHALLRATLIGSDALILGTGIAAKDFRISKTRVRLLNLAGVVGTVFGFGVALLFEVDDASAVFGIAGFGSVSGMAIGAHLTRNFDQGRELAFGSDRIRSHHPTFHEIGRKRIGYPQFFLWQHPFDTGEVVPVMRMHVSF